VALMAVTNPHLFVTEEMAGDVETRGDLTTGAAVFDRRMVPAWRHNMGVAVSTDPEAVLRQIIAALENAGRRAGNVEPGR